MKRFHVIPACLLSLSLVATIAAQDAKPQVPGQEAAPSAADRTVLVAAPVAKPTFTEQQILESYGWVVGKRLGLAELGFSKEQSDAIVRGLMMAAASNEPPYDLDKIGPQLDSFMQKKQDVFLAKLREQNNDESKAFFDKLKEGKNVVELPSGLRYEIVQPGKGPYPTATDTVKVQYTGKLINGTVFDSSAQRGPLEIQLDKVIPGWTEGLQKINQGGKIRLYIPPKLAYGDRGEQGIPPGATLIFDVELLDTKATPPAEVAPALPPPVPPKN